MNPSDHWNGYSQFSPYLSNSVCVTSGTRRTALVWFCQKLTRWTVYRRTCLCVTKPATFSTSALNTRIIITMSDNSLIFNWKCRCSRLIYDWPSHRTKFSSRFCFFLFLFLQRNLLSHLNFVKKCCTYMCQDFRKFAVLGLNSHTYNMRKMRINNHSLHNLYEEETISTNITIITSVAWCHFFRFHLISVLSSLIFWCNWFRANIPKPPTSNHPEWLRLHVFR